MSARDPGEPGRAEGEHAELARVVRDHAGRLAAALVPLVGDFSTAEDLVQDAVEAALKHWPSEGIPDRPDAWLYTVARRRGLDLLRRDRRHHTKLALVAWLPEAEPDDRLRLVFTCCHPALPRAAQVALTLRVVCGLTTAQIAKAFLVPETTVAQRITRAKRKITDAGIPYRIPDPDELAGRLSEVLAVIYLMFNEAYLPSGGKWGERGGEKGSEKGGGKGGDNGGAKGGGPDLADDAEFLAALVHQLMPAEPEVMGLLALIRLHRARAASRFTAAGEIVQLPDQDRGRWDREAIAAAGRLIARAAALHRPGPYQLQAAIVACHAEAARWADTDWAQIAVLYEMLLRLAPSPVTRLQRAIALRYVKGPAAALADLEPLAGDLADYHLFHATRAELLRDLGRKDEARAADERALRLTGNPAEQHLLQRRIT